MRKHRFCILFILFLFNYSPPALGFEHCSIEKDRVILYKVINWWYDNLDQEADFLCRKTIICRRLGQADIQYDAKNQTLTFKLENTVGELLAYGPSLFVCEQLNTDFFGNGRAGRVKKDHQGIREISFHEIEEQHAEKIQNFQEQILITLKGTITGLKNGKIALDQTGEFIKPCPELDKRPSILLTITDQATQTVLAQFSADTKSR